VSIKLGSKSIQTDLILLALEGMDVILGMNWMTLPSKNVYGFHCALTSRR